MSTGEVLSKVGQAAKAAGQTYGQMPGHEAKKEKAETEGGKKKGPVDEPARKMLSEVALVAIEQQKKKQADKRALLTPKTSVSATKAK